MALSPFELIKRGARGLINDGKEFFNAPDNSTAGIIKNTITGLPRAGKEVGTDLIQGGLRGLGTLGQAVVSPIESGIRTGRPKIDTTIKVDDKFSQLLYGQDRPSFNVTSEGREITSLFGAKEGGFSNRYVAPVIGSALPLLDAIPGGRQTRGLLKQVVPEILERFIKSNDVIGIEKQLLKEGVNTNISRRVATDIANTTDKKRVESILSNVPVSQKRVTNADSLQKLVDESGGVSTKKSGPLIDNKYPAPGVKSLPVRIANITKDTIRDIGGLFGGKSLVLRDVATSLDNFSAKKVGSRSKSSLDDSNQFGEVAKAYFNWDDSLANKMEWSKNYENSFSKVLNKFSAKDQEIVATFRLNGGSLPDYLKPLNDQITKLTDQIRIDYNKWAKANGKDEIGYIENYLPLKDDPTGIKDFVSKGISSGFTKKRTSGDFPDIEEVKLDKILAAYMENAGKKMYLDSSLKQLDEVADALLSAGAPKGSKFIKDFVHEQFNPKINSSIENAMEEVVSAKNTFALMGNLFWSTFLQTQSLALAVGRNPNIGSMFKGFGKGVAGTYKQSTFNKSLYKKFTGKEIKEDWVNDLATFRQKTKNPVSATGLGDVTTSRLGDSGLLKPRLGGKREQINRVLGWYGDAVESTLSRVSAEIAKDYGVKIGMSGQTLDKYADLMIGMTQSEYLKSTRPDALKSVWVRLFAPFQTFALESYRFQKTLVGAPGGGLPIDGAADRLKQGMYTLGAMWSMNEFQKIFTGKDITSIGGNIPIVGPFVDDKIAQLKGDKGKDENVRLPIGPWEDFKTLEKAYEDYIINGNSDPLEKIIVKWGFGFTGTGGAAIVNNLIELIKGQTRGFHNKRSGEPAFEASSEPKELIKTVIGGKFNTEAGRQYLDGGFEVTGAQSRESLKAEIKDKRESGEYGSDKVAVEAYKSGLKDIIKVDKVNRLKIEDEIEYKIALRQAVDNGDVSKKDAVKEYEAYKKQDDNPFDRGIFGLPGAFLKAATIDPVRTVKVFFTKEKLGRVQGNLVSLQRFYGRDEGVPGYKIKDVVGGSDDVKERLMQQQGISTKKKGYYRLEHIFPVDAGGGSEDSNLLIIPKSLHGYFTKYDKLLGAAVRSKKITMKEAEVLSRAFKVEKTITAMELEGQLKLTPEERAAFNELKEKFKK